VPNQLSDEAVSKQVEALGVGLPKSLASVGDSDEATMEALKGSCADEEVK